MSVRYKEVPEAWKAPYGPYRKAPAEYGGEWWLVNPFSSAEPWKRFYDAPKEQTLPEGFVEIFGPEPKGYEYRMHPNPSLAYRIALDQWNLDLKRFVRAGIPEFVDGRELEHLNSIYEQWEMGPIYFYEGRYGWMARFPDSEIEDYEAAVHTAVEYPHLVIANYQAKAAALGLEPPVRHPFVPEWVWAPFDKTED